MRTLIIAVLLSFYTLAAKSQDQIVTKALDTIFCEIQKVDEEYIYFKVKEIGKKEKETLINLDQVLEFSNNNPTKNTYLDKGKVDRINEQEPETTVVQSLPRVRFEFNGGVSYLLATGINDLPPAVQPYYQNLRWGAYFNSNLAWYFKKSMGIGIQLNLFNTQNEEELYQINLDGTMLSGTIQDNITHRFIGVSYNTRVESTKSRSSVHFITALGWIAYTNHAAFFNKYTITGGSFGYYGGVSYDFDIYKKFAIGANLGVVLGAMQRYSIDDGYTKQEVTFPTGQYESLSRVELGVGFRFKQ